MFDYTFNGDDPFRAAYHQDPKFESCVHCGEAVTPDVEGVYVHVCNGARSCEGQQSVATP